MNLPKVLTDLVAAQNTHDSAAYANCFSETAIVYDEGKLHTGREAIKNWISQANEKYKAVMKPLAYSPTEQTLQAQIAGTFPGSPLVLTYHYEMQNGLIQALRII